ncbi:CHAT domain-containing protein [Aquimarina pacifica]|uniref:CHAT domain-containing protein n=1 Tax=Aquimarina pacifica TaxID=1296415 RepID=UPI000470668C|nr:CHAT domain-containing tetratricopeptide repeat protein [Aquimarina pacifica]
MKPTIPFSVLSYLLLILVISNNIQGQVKIDTILASQYYKKADSFLADRKPDSSIVYFKKALPLYKKEKTWKRVANCYNKISENQWRMNKLDESLENIKKVIEICNTHLEKNTNEEANAYDNMGNYYQKKTNYDKALEYHHRALAIRQKLFPEIYISIAKSYANLGLLNYFKANYNESLQYYKKAEAIYIQTVGPNHPETGNTYNNMGGVYIQLGDFTNAIMCYKKDLEIIIKNYGKEHIFAAQSYFNIGQYYEKQNQLDAALTYYQKALPLILQEKKNKYPLSLLYLNMGVVLEKKGEYNKALKFSKKSLDLRIEIFGKKHLRNAIIYNNLGTLSLHNGNTIAALNYYNKALNIYEAAYVNNHNNVAFVLRNLGNLYLTKKDYTNALKYYKKSISINNVVYGINHHETADTYSQIGKVYFEKGKYEIAFEYYNKGLSMMHSIYSEKHVSTIIIYLEICALYKKQKEYTKAIEYYDKAILSNLKNNNTKIVSSTFDPNHYYDNITLLEALQGKAKTLQYRYLQKGLKKDLDQSIVLYKNIDILINTIRQSYQNYQDKVTFSKLAKEAYTDGIEACLLAYKETKEQHSLEKAFYYAEKSKANTLKELLAETNAKGVAGLSKTLLETEQNLKTNSAFYQSQILGEQSNSPIDSIKIKKYENKLFAIDQTQDSLLLVFEKEYPKYYQLKHQNDIISVKEIQKKLKKSTTVLEFFTSDSTTYAFTISKNNIAVKEIATLKLTEQIENLRTSITSKDTRVFKTISYQLYQQIIGPIKDQIVGDELIIIPDGPLWYLNFELLLTQDDSSNNPKNLSYLLNDYAVTYANSATLLFDPFKRELNSEKRSECLAFSFSDNANTNTSTSMSFASLRDAGDDLPGTRKEIKAIADIIDGQYYYGSEAVESNFKKNISNYSIIHLALHGEVDNKRPQNSKLFFTKSKDTIEDNLLYAHELFSLDIPAELAVLSACNTGSGKIAKGEGIMSLGNAFQYAGTKSLLLSSWKISDQTTPILMRNFYSNLKNGMNKAKALQQAKLQYLKTANINRTDPFYWGGFYLVGDATPIAFENTILWYWCIGLAVLGCLLLGLFLYRRNRN